jgi:hypothetical protein
MKWLNAIFAAIRKRLTGSAIRASYPRLPIAVTSGVASRAYPMPKGGGDLPALRLILLFEAKRARDMRQSKLAAAIEADLRSVTHQILTKGK